MDYDAMIDRSIGRARYRAACDWALRTAAGTGRAERPEEWPDRLAEVPHDLADPIWFNDGPSLAERIAWGLRLLREMPCYASAMYASGKLDGVTPAERLSWWRGCAELLDSADDRLADPVSYWLWADPFEDPALADEAWRALTEPAPVPELRTRRLLASSGPVPWSTKAPLLQRLADDVRWHDAVLIALVAAAFDTYGAVERSEASDLLDRVQAVGDDSLVAALRSRLSA